MKTDAKKCILEKQSFLKQPQILDLIGNKTAPQETVKSVYHNKNKSGTVNVIVLSYDQIKGKPAMGNWVVYGLKLATLEAQLINSTCPLESSKESTAACGGGCLAPGMCLNCKQVKWF